MASRLTAGQAYELLGIADKGGRKNTRRYKFYAFWNALLAKAVDVVFFAANILAFWLVFSFLG